MNDPGLDEPIGQTSDRVEKGRKEEEDLEREEEQAYLKPRYTVRQSSIATSLTQIVAGGLRLLLSH